MTDLEFFYILASWYTSTRAKTWSIRFDADLSSNLFRRAPNSFIGQSVEQVDRVYRTTLGFPVPLKEDVVAGAIRLPRLNGIDRPVEGKRFREFNASEELPVERPEPWIDSARRLAVIAGRVHNRPQAPAPSSSLSSRRVESHGNVDAVAGARSEGVFL